MYPCASPHHHPFPPPSPGMSILGQRSHPGPNPAHTSPLAALTSEDKDPERCFQRGEQHGGLHSWMARSCQEQSRMSTALPQRGLPHPPWAGGPKPPAEPQTHFSTSETSHLFPVFSFALPEGWSVPHRAGSAGGALSKASPTGKQGFC